MAADIDPAHTSEDAGKDFKKLAARFIAGHIGGGSTGIAKLFDVTDRLDPSTSGNLFEAWLTRNYFPQAVGRLHINTGSIAGHYTRKVIHSDNLMDSGNGWTVIEMKHLRTSTTFGEDQLNQASNYAQLIENHVPYGPAGSAQKPINKVIYVFSSRVAAQINAPEIHNRLGLHAEIRYIDRGSSEMVTLDAR
jgi:hypothetical protein